MKTKNKFSININGQSFELDGKPLSSVKIVPKKNYKSNFPHVSAEISEVNLVFRTANKPAEILFDKLARFNNMCGNTDDYEHLKGEWKKICVFFFR